MSVSKSDCSILRELGHRVAEIAALPVQEETRQLWKSLNRLQPVRPMVRIDQVPWHEMDVDGELTLRTEDAFCRDIEGRLRKTLYSWTHMRADMVVQPFIEIPKIVGGLGFGLSLKEETISLDPRNDIVSHCYEDQLQTEDDLEKILMPEVRLDSAATEQAEEKAHSIFDGVIDIHMQGVSPRFAVWDLVAMLRGAQNLIFDLIERPEFTRKLLVRFTTAHLSLLDQLEEQGLLDARQSTVHCSGAHTDELPAAGFDPDRPRAKDMWTHGMAQIFSTVSPAMHQEFELDYAVKWYERFGLVYYGCCEPLHNKIGIVKRIPHLRKISISPWADVESSAEQIGKDFVMSRKPNPALLAGSEWSTEAVRTELLQTLESCSSHQCPVEFILKDISTLCYEPQRLWQWADTAMRLVQ